jgi:hypothetical protein
MNELPKQIDKEVRRALAALDRPWKLIKKRDHYFLQIEDQPMICVANNSSKRNDWQVSKTLESIRKAYAYPYPHGCV